MALACAVVLTGVAALSSRPAQARSEVKPPPLVGGHYQRLQAGRVVDVRQLSSQPSTGNVVVPNHTVVRHVKSYAPSSATAVPHGQPLQVTGPVTGPIEEQLTVFPGFGLAQGAGLNMGPVEPPDTQIAVGPDKVIEMVNNTVTTWSKAGAQLSLTNLFTFFPVPAGFSVTDPRVLYDAASGRFIATAFAIDPASDSQVYLAVSQTSDPGGAWSEWVVKSTSHIITDQPKVGVSDDKVTISWAEGVPPPCQAQTTLICFTGEVTVVLQKSDLLGGPTGAPHSFVWGPDLTRFGILPVHSLSPTTTQYLVYNDADPYWAVENQCAQTQGALYGTCPTLGIVAITGTPAAGNIALAEANPAINSTVAPPDAQQLGGTTTTMLLSTGDDRLVSAVYQRNRITTSATDGNDCSLANPVSTPQGSCLLVLQAATDQAGFPIVESRLMGGAGDYAFYPAIGLDGAALVVAFSRSNLGMSPGAWVTGIQSFGDPPAPWTSIAAGAGKYDTTGCGGHNRWGDYSAAATDPTDPTDVWVAAEYAPSATNSCLWATSIARLTYSAPTVTSVTPQIGNAGTSTVITGTDFVSGATTVYFGANTASAVTVQTPNRLTATAPSGSGLVSVLASTADGLGPPGAQFKYLRLDAGAPLVARQAGGVVRGDAPSSVPPSTAGPRPLLLTPSSRQSTPSPLAGERGGGSISQLWLSIQLAVLRFFAFVLSP